MGGDNEYDKFAERPETLRRIGDVSAGVQAPINEIAEFYGKVRVQEAVQFVIVVFQRGQALDLITSSLQLDTRLLSRDSGGWWAVTSGNLLSVTMSRHGAYGTS